jgi:hypothetical protein
MGAVINDSAKLSGITLKECYKISMHNNAPILKMIQSMMNEEFPNTFDMD